MLAAPIMPQTCRRTRVGFAMSAARPPYTYSMMSWAFMPDTAQQTPPGPRMDPCLVETSHTSRSSRSSPYTSRKRPLPSMAIQDHHLQTAPMMQTTSSQTVRRRLLRRTRNEQELSQRQSGQTVAFWRWQGRSRQHKKGSWSLGRFLAFDSDQKSCWTAGSSWQDIGNNQIRFCWYVATW